MPANTTNAAQLAVLLVGAVSDALHGTSEMSLWRGRHVKTAPFATQWIRSAQKTPWRDMTSVGEMQSFEIQRSGEYFRGMFAEIEAPLLATVSAAAIKHATGIVTDADTKKMLVDDLSHDRYGVRNAVWADGAGAAFVNHILLLSEYLSTNPDGAASLSGGTVTAASAAGAKGCSRYFPLTDAVAHYCRFAPIYLLQKVVLSSADQSIDEIVPLAILSALEFWRAAGTGIAGECINDSDDVGDLRAWAQSERLWLIPIPFFCTMSASQAFRSRAFHNHTLKVDFYFNALGKVIVGDPVNCHVLTSFPTAPVTDPVTASVWEVKTTATGKLGENLTPIGGGIPATTVAASMFKFRFIYERIHGTQAERKLVHNSAGEQIIVQHKLFNPLSLKNDQLTAGSEYEMTTFKPTLSVAAFVFAVRRKSQVEQNKQMDFSGVPSPLIGNSGRQQGVQHMLTQIRLDLTSETKFEATPNELHRLQPAMYAANSEPLEGLMLYSCGDGNPYSLQKRGDLAFDAVDDPTLHVTTNANAAADHTAEGGVLGETATFHCLQLRFNTLSWSDGMGSADWV